MIEKGTIIEGPDGMGYKITTPLMGGDVITTAHLEPFGGAPKPKELDPMVDWLVDWFERACRRHE